MKFRLKSMLIFSIFSLTIPLLALSCSQKPLINTKNSQITLFSTNDIHGRLIEDKKQKTAGIQNVAAYLKKQNYDLLLDAGDLIQGTSLNDFDQGNTIAKIAKEMKYDAIAVGNHEFDFGLNNLLNINQNIIPFLSSNIMNSSNNQKIFESSRIKILKDDLKVGLIGVTTPETSTTTFIDNIHGLQFNDIVSEVRKEINYFKKQGINFIVIVGHLGENDAINLAKNFKDDIDLIVDGHSHTEYYAKVYNTYIVQTGEYLKTIRKSTFDFNKETGFIENFNTQLIDYEELTNPNYLVPSLIENLINDLKIKEENEFGKYIVDIPFVLNGERSNVRFKETNLGDFIADAFYYFSKQIVADLDFAIVNSGCIRTSLNSGTITKRDVYNVLPFLNRLKVAETTGENIINSFKYSLSKIGQGSMLQVSSQIIINKLTNQFLIFNYQTNKYEEINPSKKYKFTTTDFILEGGGDGYNWLDVRQSNSGTTLVKTEKSNWIKEYAEEYLKIVFNDKSLKEKYSIEFPNKRLIY